MPEPIFKKLGKPAEVEKWKRQFAEADPHNFAVLKISGASVDQNLEPFAEGIEFLYWIRQYAPIIYGWGETLTKRLDQEEIHYDWHNGDRITTPEAMKHVKAISQEYGNRIVQAFKEKGIKAELCEDVFLAKPQQWDDVPYEHKNGQVVGIKKKRLVDLIMQEIFPIVSPLGNYNGELLNINADTAACKLVEQMNPLKYIKITNIGGILDRSGNIISKILLGRDYHSLLDSRTVTGGMAKGLYEARNVLETSSDGHPHSVQITHPAKLIEELYTDHGSGTYISRE